MYYIIGNWKSNKSLSQAVIWLEEFIKTMPTIIKGRQTSKCSVILCPTYIHLPVLTKQLQNKSLPLDFKLGAQNVSPFAAGAYTGEISAQILKEFVKYIIIGHSERRNYFSETELILEKKVFQAQTYGLEPIYCIQSAETPIPVSVKIVAYEPVTAIGTGNPTQPVEANKIIGQIKQEHPYVKIGIYGGSVTAENVTSFLVQPEIDGALAGKASLDAQEFTQIIAQAGQIQA